jgi:hypothetical protein
MPNEQLKLNETQYLRDQKLIRETEYAYRAGDLIIAEDPVTGEKRVVGQTGILTESNRRVLKG